MGAYGNVGAVTYLTIFSLLPMWMGGGAEPTPEIIASSNSAFFQVLGVAGLVVATTRPATPSTWKKALLEEAMISGVGSAPPPIHMGSKLKMVRYVTAPTLP